MIMDNENACKARILAQLLYRAIVRYVKAKKAQITERKSNFSLDSSRVQRQRVVGNKQLQAKTSLREELKGRML